MYQGSLVIAGECMCTRPFAMRNEPEFLELLKVLRDADTVYCHLEMNYNRKDATPGAPTMFGALRGDPGVAIDLKWAGIDLVSCAFNHAMEWGYDGIFGTIEALDKAGIVHAGTGRNLEEAREPAYFESQAGRVAIISMASGNSPHDSAHAVKAPLSGKPGINPLRVRQKYIVTPQQLENLTEMWRMLGLQMEKAGEQGGEKGDTILVAGDIGGGDSATLTFKAGDKVGVQSIPNKWDVEGNLRAIKNARRQADLVIVAHHAALNEGKRGDTQDGKRGDTPVSFVPPFAKECLDAGADVYVGHGWHRQLGIEFYKGKPIIYGTGNFFEQSQFKAGYPAASYESMGFNPDDLAKLTPVDIDDLRATRVPWKIDAGGVIATLSVEGGKFTGMKLYPYSLGADFSGDAKTGQARKTGTKMEGRPMLTHGENAKRIIEHVSKLSEPFNTRIEYKDGVGVVTMK